MDNERLARRAETHVAIRKGLLIINALSYIGWVGLEGLAHAKAFGLSLAVWDMIRNLSRPIWAISFFLILAQSVMLKRNRDLAVLVDDERSGARKNLAYMGGYWILLLATSGLYLAAVLTPGLDMRTFMPLMLGIGVAAPIFAVTFFGRD